jgi:DNA-binding CsgD family transcriptional regulator
MIVSELARAMHSKQADIPSEDLIRLLLGHAAIANDAPQAHRSDPAAEETLLDIDVDGSRYLLIRMPMVNPLRAQLSPREREIVRMVAQGHANKIIADVLGISAWTVCTHLRRIFAKLGVGSRAAMVARLLETGGRSPEPPGRQNKESAIRVLANKNRGE